MTLDTGPFIPERIEQWAYWIVEREAMRVRKEAGKGTVASAQTRLWQAPAGATCAAWTTRYLSG
jgi:hypothetical protein